MKNYPPHPYCIFKTDHVKQRTDFLCDQAAEVLCEMAEYCEDRKLPFVITDSVSTPSEDKRLCRTSSTHRQGRAFDISIRGWLPMAIEVFIYFFEQRFASCAALSKTGGTNLIELHDNGNGKHMHVQVASLYALKDPFSKKTIA